MNALCMRLLQEVCIGLQKGFHKRSFWVVRKRWVFYNKLVQLISKVVGTLRTPVAVIDGKERASGPNIYLLELGLDDVQNDADSVFIVVANHALVRICCVSGDNAIFLRGKFSGVVILFKL
jgi:hypothetical protein